MQNLVIQKAPDLDDVLRVGPSVRVILKRSVHLKKNVLSMVIINFMVPYTGSSLCRSVCII